MSPLIYSENKLTIFFLPWQVWMFVCLVEWNIAFLTYTFYYCFWTLFINYRKIINGMTDLKKFFSSKLLLTDASEKSYGYVSRQW